MAGQDRATKDKMMAAHLKDMGIFHGVRLSSTNAPPVPKMKDIGTAKYRRYVQWEQSGRKSRKNDTQRQKEWQ